MVTLPPPVIFKIQHLLKLLPVTFSIPKVMQTGTLVIFKQVSLMQNVFLYWLNLLHGTTKISLILIVVSPFQGLSLENRMKPK